MIRLNYLKIIVSYLFVGCIFSCGKNSSEGVFVRSRSFVKMEGAKPVLSEEMSDTLWVLDNSFIEQLPLYNLFQDSLNRVTAVKFIRYYALLDKKNITYFHRFSDTATPIKKIVNPNAFKLDGGWDFNSTESLERDSLINFKDTLCGPILYGRKKLYRTIDNQSLYIMLYYNCKENTPVKFLKSLSDSIGCPIVRMDTYIDEQLSTSTEIKCIREHLNSNESSIFERWRAIQLN